MFSRLRSVANMGRLRAFYADQSVNLNKRGFFYLSARDAKTKQSVTIQFGEL